MAQVCAIAVLVHLALLAAPSAASLSPDACDVPRPECRGPDEECREADEEAASLSQLYIRGGAVRKGAQAAADQASGTQQRGWQSASTGGGDSLATGYGLALLSAIFNGSFSVFLKMSKSEPDPVIFNTFLTYGTLLMSLAVPLLQAITGSEQVWLGLTGWGMLAGGCFVCSTLFSFIAIQLAGLTVACCTWSTSAIVVAFLWGAVGPISPPRQPMGSSVLSLLAVLLLLAGAVVINLCRQLGQRMRPPVEHYRDSAQASVVSPKQGAAVGEKYKMLGIVSAVTVGLFGGSVLVPASYVPLEAAGLRLLPSFGIGAGLTGTVIGALYWLLRRPHVSREAACNGILAGVVWSLGNVCQIVAQTTYRMPYGIAYPILQCGLVFGGIWGIYFFKEESNPVAIKVFWAGVAVVGAGVVLLGLYGPGS